MNQKLINALGDMLGIDVGERLREAGDQTRVVLVTPGATPTGFSAESLDKFLHRAMGIRGLKTLFDPIESLVENAFETIGEYIQINSFSVDLTHQVNPRTGEASTDITETVLRLDILPTFRVQLLGATLSNIRLTACHNYNPSYIRLYFTLQADIELFGQAFTLTLEPQTKRISIALKNPKTADFERLLQNASGQSFAQLAANQGLQPTTGNKVEILAFNATGTLAQNTRLACDFGVRFSHLSWGELSVQTLALQFDHRFGGGGQTSFTLGLGVAIGQLQLLGGLSHNTSSQTTNATIEVVVDDLSIADVIAQMGDTLGFSVDLSALDGVNVTHIGLVVTRRNVGQGSEPEQSRTTANDFVLSLRAQMRVHDDTPPLDVRFQFQRAAATTGPEVVVQLAVNQNLFTYLGQNSQKALIFKGENQITLSALASLIGFDTSDEDDDPLSKYWVSLEAATFCFAPATEPGERGAKLFAIALGMGDAAQIDVAISRLLLGGSLGVQGLELAFASGPWSADSLATISATARRQGLALPTLFDDPDGLSSGASGTFKLKLGQDIRTLGFRAKPGHQAPQHQALERVPVPVQAQVRSTPDDTPTRPFNADFDPPATAEIDDDVQAPTPQWFNVGKSIGPLDIQRLGFFYDVMSGFVILGLDGGMTIGPMSARAKGLTLRLSPADLQALVVSLEGLSLAYNRPPLRIEGGFVKDSTDPHSPLYNGQFLIQSPGLALSALGQYATVDGHTSLMLFGSMTRPPLGGPPPFVVNGLAAGFGYNSELVVPRAPSDVDDFALIKAARGDFGDKDPFEVLASTIQPRLGENWVAMGLTFTSFEVLETTALLVGAFGEDLELAVVGRSSLSIPPQSKNPIAQATLDFLARYDPASLSIVVRGELTDNSYILDPDCMLSGGFAVQIGAGGDFLFTIGGYHPRYDWESHGFPALPRIGLNWPINDTLSVEGEAYFALTTDAMMAGGYLRACFETAVVSASFQMGFDILVQWKPFYYDIDIYICVTVALDLDLGLVDLSGSFSVGARLALSGPPMHGIAQIETPAKTISIEFGAVPSVPGPLDWQSFRDMLPGDAQDDGTDSALLPCALSAGLRQDLSQADTLPALNDPAYLSHHRSNHHDASHHVDQVDWVIDGANFAFDIGSALPITDVATAIKSAIGPLGEVPQIGVLPMGEEHATTCFDFEIQDGHGNVLDLVNQGLAELIPMDQQFSKAHWGTRKPTGPNVPRLEAIGSFRLNAVRQSSQATSSIPQSKLLARNRTVQSISDRQAHFDPFSSSPLGRPSAPDAPQG